MISSSTPHSRANQDVLTNQMMGMANDFDDVGLPSHVDDYFETNPNDLSYAYENTNREMILGEVNLLDFQSE